MIEARLIGGVDVMSWHERIKVDPKVLGGKPVVNGTRLAVEFIVERLADGWSERQVLGNYPGLAHEDILACLQYAAELSGPNSAA